MPTITRTFLKASLIYFLLAMLLGVLLGFRVAALAPSWISSLSPVYFHLFLVGWVTQLIFGVVIWMFPKYSLAKPRGDERLAWSVFLLLNLGLILRAITEPLNAAMPGSVWGWLLALSAVLQWIAGILFVLITWPRVKER